MYIAQNYPYIYIFVKFCIDIALDDFVHFFIKLFKLVIS